jgi:hypothetical protein
MKIAALAIFAAVDVILSLLLRRFVFVDIQRPWQFWGTFLYAVFLSGLYFELLGDNGFVMFEFDSLYSIGYWILVAYSLSMVAFHMWASRIFHENS